MDIPKIQLTATADLGMVTFTVTGKTGIDGTSISAEFQIWNEYDDEHFVLASPRDGNYTPIALNIPDGGIPGSVTFKQAMDVGHIKAAKVVLFPVGKNFAAPLLDDNGKPLEFWPLPLDVTIATAQVRVSAPQLVITGVPSDIAPGGYAFGMADANSLDWVNSGVSLDDPRLVQNPNGTGRSGQVWYPPNINAPISIAMTLQQKTCVSFYLMNAPADASIYHVELYDAQDNLLGKRDLDNVTAGGYVRFNCSGSVKFKLPKTVFTGIFFDPPTADDTGIDRATKGNWIGKYGSLGYVFPHTNKFPDVLKGAAAPDGNLHVPFRIELPQGYHMPDGGFWLQAKGNSLDPTNADYLFSQIWVQVETGHAAEGYTPSPDTHIADGPDPYEYVDGEFSMKIPAAGVYAMQYMIFNSLWNMLQWQAGPTVEVGGESWVHKADKALFPALFAQRAKLGKWDFANHGNAAYTLLNRPKNDGWARYPANIDAASFATLRVRVGAKCVRYVIDGDAFMNNAYYEHFIDSVVEQMIMGGVIPYIEPQVPPAGGVDGLSRFWKKMVAKFNTYPMVYGICNEPSTYPAWSGKGGWREVLLRITSEIYAAQPDAVIVGSLEGWSKDARAACADPLPKGTVFCYALHGYVDNAQILKVNLGDGSIPIWMQEAIDPSEEFFAVIASHPNIVGVSYWTWNTLGNDALPLPESYVPFVPTERGAKMLAYAAKAKAGAYDNGAIPVPVPDPTPPPNPDPSPSPGPTPNPNPTPTPAPQPTPAPTVDLTPILQRLTAIEGTIANVPALILAAIAPTEARLTRLETPAPVLPPPAPAPLPVPDATPAERYSYGTVAVAGWRQNVGIVEGKPWPPDGPVTQTIDVSASGSGPQLLYQQYLTNPVPGGLVTVSVPMSAAGKVRLHFSEDYYAGAGYRKVDIAIGGKLVRMGFDIYTQAGGAFKAITLDFDAVPIGGEVVVQVRSVGGSYPLLCAVETV